MKTYVAFEPVARLLHIPVPRLQRCLNTEHVDGMIQDQVREYASHACFSILQSITVGILHGDKYIIDGQHRLAAYDKLRQMGYPIHEVIVPVVFYHASCKEELSDYYNRINKNMPIHPFETDEAWEDVGKVFCGLFQDSFGSYVKPSKSCRCPHISLDELKTHLQARNITSRLSNTSKTVHDFWKCVIDLNTQMHGKVNDQMCPKMHKRLQECVAKSVKSKCMPCFLGAWRHFEWLDIALHRLEHPNEEISLCIAENARCRIPVILREQVWKKHNVNTCDIGECFACNTPLRYMDMECGHIIAHALGGETTLGNLMPICKACNRDMGIMNLLHYKNMIDRFIDGGSSIMDLD